MSGLFPRLERRLVRRLLRTGIRVQGAQDRLREVAETLAGLGLVSLTHRRYVRCVNPADEDYWQVTDRDCPGESEVDDEGPQDCPECGRVIDYPATRKQVFEDLIINVSREGVTRHLVTALQALDTVAALGPLGPAAAKVRLADGKAVAVALVDYLGAGWRAPGPDTKIPHMYVIASPINRPAHEYLERAYHIELADILANDQAWLSGAIQSAARSRPMALVCYAPDDRAWADRLVEDLVANGVGVWLDRLEVKEADSIPDRIRERPLESNYLVLVLSTDSARSPWRHPELTSAWIRGLEAQNIVILPVLCRDGKIPPYLAHKHYTDCRGEGYEQGVRELLGLLAPTVEPYPAAPVHWGRRPPEAAEVRTQQTVENTSDLNSFLAFICDHFDSEQVKALCFDLGVPYEDLPSRGTRSKARDLLSYLARRGRLKDLQETLRQERPAAFAKADLKLPEAQFFALIIGIADYKHIRHLSKTTSDARDLYDFLSTNGYPTSNMVLVMDNLASKPVISDKLDWLARRTQPDDTVLIFFSGHGAQRIGGFEPGEYLCPVEADWYNLHASAISNDEFNTALRAIHAGRVAVFLDACHSGGVGEPRDAALQIKSGLSETTYGELAEGRGRAVIASCRPGEVSWELPDMRNGLFTHYLLEGLRGAAAGTDGVVRILSLFDYVSRKVPQHRDQHPLFKGELELNFALTARTKL